MMPPLIWLWTASGLMGRPHSCTATTLQHADRRPSRCRPAPARTARRRSRRRAGPASPPAGSRSPPARRWGSPRTPASRISAWPGPLVASIAPAACAARDDQRLARRHLEASWPPRPGAYPSPRAPAWRTAGVMPPASCCRPTTGRSATACRRSGCRRPLGAQGPDPRRPPSRAPSASPCRCPSPTSAAAPSRRARSAPRTRESMSTISATSTCPRRCPILIGPFSAPGAWRCAQPIRSAPIRRSSRRATRSGDVARPPSSSASSRSRSASEVDADPLGQLVDQLIEREHALRHARRCGTPRPARVGEHVVLPRAQPPGPGTFRRRPADARAGRDPARAVARQIDRRERAVLARAQASAAGSCSAGCPPPCAAPAIQDEPHRRLRAATARPPPRRSGPRRTSRRTRRP